MDFIKDILIDLFTSHVKEPEHKIAIRKWLSDHSLNCSKCNSPSYPIFDTEDRYRCINCERQFINAQHFVASNLRKIVGSTPFQNKALDLYEENISEFKLKINGENQS